MRVFVLDDLDISMNEEMNDEVAYVQFGILVADLVEHFEEQQSSRMHGRHSALYSGVPSY